MLDYATGCDANNSANIDAIRNQAIPYSKEASQAAVFSFGHTIMTHGLY